LTNAEIEYKRAVELKEIKTKQEFEQAKKALDFAQEEFKAAKDKLTFFETQSITLKAPLSGVILQLHVGPGQYVQTSAPLVTIIDLQPVWIRVPVSEYDYEIVDTTSKVEVAYKNANHGRTDKPATFTAKLAARVPLVDPIKHTGDLWYELEGVKDTDRFVKDQMVTVKVPLRSQLAKAEKASVVPVSAVIYDAKGHGWIYLEITKDGDAKHRFERRPVEVTGSTDEGLILRSNLSAGDRVVTSGAAVLFSRDFHKTPVKIDGEDE
jgi:RND family efflux transporter MFP subunit